MEGKESFNSSGKKGKINNKQEQIVQGIIKFFSFFWEIKGKIKNRIK